MNGRRAARWLQTAAQLLQQVRAATAERDPVAGKTTRRSTQRTRIADDRCRIEYRPEADGDADPGEVVWAWVPYQEDPNRGKDRPVVLVGRFADDWAGVPLTSKKKGRADHVPVGSGGWDPKRRPSWAKVDQLLHLDDDDIRREGSALDKHRFDDVIGNLARYHDIAR
jgi:hypothetical protein